MNGTKSRQVTYLSQAKLKSTVEPYAPLLSSIADTCFQRFEALLRAAPEVQADVRPGTLMALFNDLMCAEVGRRCGNDPLSRLTVVKHYGRRLVLIDGWLQLRLKKADHKDRVSGSKTWRQKELYQPGLVQLSLDTDIVPDKVLGQIDGTFAWRFNEARTKLEDKRIIFGPGHPLNFSIKDLGISGLAEIVPFTPPTAPKNSKKRRGAISKDDIKRREEAQRKEQDEAG